MIGNWRSTIIPMAFRLSGSRAFNYYEEILKISKMNENDLKNYQASKLKNLLIHSHKNVPYYRDILAKYDVVTPNQKVKLENFQNLPLLTKEIIRKNQNSLLSEDYKHRSTYLNTSGGSTGEPINLIQDRFYDDWNTANKLFMTTLAGKSLGEREVKLWGSERDILEGTIGHKAKLKNFIYNRKFLNSFIMSESDMERYVIAINNYQPYYIWTYVDSILYLAKYIEAHNIKVFSPRSIVTTAGVLTEEMREYIQAIFGTKVVNQYGSREVGGIASECLKQDGLHVFDWSHYVEIVDNNIYVTLLTNYSMPLIRYNIGDTAEMYRKVSAHLQSTRIKKVTGRVTDHFIKKDGTVIHGEYFTHLFYFLNWVKQFKVVQDDYNNITCYVVIENKPIQKDVIDIEAKIKQVMGEKCKLNWIIVKNIKPTASGKYRYTVSRLCR